MAVTLAVCFFFCFNIGYSFLTASAFSFSTATSVNFTWCIKLRSVWLQMVKVNDKNKKGWFNTELTECEVSIKSIKVTPNADILDTWPVLQT